MTQPIIVSKNTVYIISLLWLFHKLLNDTKITFAFSLCNIEAVLNPIFDLFCF